MSSIGKKITPGSSKLFSGPLGVCQIGFDGYDLGFTTDATELQPDQDIMDIMYQQQGTKAADNVRTGQEMLLTTVFGEISTQMLVLMQKGITSSNVNPASDSAILGRNVYESMLENEAKGLKVAAIGPDGLPSSLLPDIMSFYTAFPLLDAAMVNWSADSQRNLAVTFRIKFYEFPTPHSYAENGAFGYLGDPTDENVPPIVYTDREGPYVLSAETTAATTIEATMSEDVTADAGIVDRTIVTVDGDFIVPSAVVVQTDPDDNKVDITVAAITAGQVVTVGFLPDAMTDNDGESNPNDRIVDYPVINNVV